MYMCELKAYLNPLHLTKVTVT